MKNNEYAQCLIVSANYDANTIYMRIDTYIHNTYIIAYFIFTAFSYHSSRSFSS